MTAPDHASDHASGQASDSASGTHVLDTDWVRAQFPAFDEPDLQGWVNAQNAGGSYRCRQVLDRLLAFHRRTAVQGGTHFPAGAAHQEAMDATAPALARWLRVRPDEVHVGPSTTALTYAVGRAFAAVLGPGDAVVVTDQDHEANSGAWRRLADIGVEMREWRVDPESGRLALADLDPLLDDDVALVAFPHVSNVVGEVNPVAEVAARAHAVGAVAIADGVAAAPHGLPDVDALGVDAYLFSSYKVYGPHQGVLAMRRELADRLPNQGHFFNADQVTKKFVPAGPDHAQVAALAGVVEYLEDLVDHHRSGPGHDDDDDAAGGGADGAGGDQVDPAGHDHLRSLVHAHETALVSRLLDVVVDRPGVRVVGPTDVAGKVPLLAVVADRPAPELAAELADHDVMAAAGHFYARRLVDALGLDPEAGVLRLSLVHYNTVAEVERVAAALDAILPG